MTGASLALAAEAVAMADRVAADRFLTLAEEAARSIRDWARELRLSSVATAYA
jgi:hypothetical protein